MHSNPQSPPNPSNTHSNNKEDPFSFEFYLNQSPEQKQEQTTNYSHHHHQLYNREQHHQSIQSHQSYSPEHSQSSSTSLSPIQDEEDHHQSNDQDLSLNLNDQDFTSSYSSTLDEPFSTVPLSRSSSAHAFSTNSLGLQSDEMSLSMDQSNHGNNNGGGGFSSVKMTHSDSAPAFSFINPQLDRRDSFLSNCSSSPSASSTLSLANSYSSSYNGNQQHFRRSNAVNYNNGGGSVSPASYISHPSLSLPSPCPSPLGLPTALSSISGLAIIDGGNGNGSTSNSSASSPQSQANHLNNHQQLMALSSDGENGKHQNMGMPLDLNLGMGVMDGGNGNDGQWNGNERWWNNNNSNQRSSPNSARPTLGNALGLNSSMDQDGGEDMDQDEEEDDEEDDEQDGQQPSKRRAPPGVNDMEEALPSPARSTAASRKDSSPAFRATRPLGIILKRRATASNVNEITPVALSRPSFAGQTSTAASDLVRHRHSISNTSHPQQFASSHQHHHPHPQTPRNDTVPINSLNSAISMSSTPGMQTPASSHSVTATPDYSTLSLSTPSSAMKRSSSYHLGGSSYTQQSDFESPSQSMMPPRLQRGQSYSGLAMGMSKCQDLNEGMDLPVGLPAHLQFGRNLERVMNDGSNEEHGLGIAGNGMVPLSPFRSPQSRPAMTRNFTTSSVPQDPPHSAGYPSAAFSMAHLAAESPAKMQRSQSLGMGAPQSLPSSAYSTSGSSDGLSFSPAASSRGLPSSLGYPFTYGASVPSTPNGPTNDLNSSSYYTAPTPSMKLTLSKGNASRRKAAPPPLVVSSTGKSHACHCGKRFRRAEHLKRHQRAHTEEKPHHCVLHGCGKAFGRSDNLAQHLKTHFKHVALSKEDLKRLMDDSKILVTSGKASTLANTLESQEKEAAKFAPPVPSKKRNMSKKRNVDGDVKEPSKKAGASKKNNINKNDAETHVATWSANDSHHQSPQRQALSPTGSAVANSPPDFLQNSNLSLYSN